MKISVNSPLEHLAAFALASSAGVLSTAIATGYVAWVKCRNDWP